MITISSIKELPLQRTAASMDYLSLLPIELWKEIFLQIPTHWSIGSDRSRDPLIFLKKFGFGLRGTIRAQSERAKLLGICKSLMPLAESILFSEVCLTSIAKITSFASVATAVREGGYRRGDLTRRISIYLVTSEFEHVLASDSLKMACPNLATLHVFSDDIPVVAWQAWMDHWKEDIKVFTWTDFRLSFDDMFTVASHFIRLTSLDLGSFTVFQSTTSTQTYTFPSVRRLVLNRLCLQRFDISKLTCPSLEWLSVNIPAHIPIHKIDEFVQRHSDTVTGLDIETGDEVKANEVISGPMVSTPLLKTLILSLPTLRFPILLSNTTGCHPALRTLYLRVNNTALVPQLHSFILNLKQAPFRQLDLVILVIHPRFDRYGMNGIRLLMAEPPAGTSVIFQPDPTRYDDDMSNLPVFVIDE
jgi:hypothetical protein